MRSRRRDLGSAMIIAVVIVVMVLGIGGAFMAESLFRGQTQFASIQAQEAQLMCDAAIEKVRRDLWVYKNSETWDWNDILSYCSTMSTDPDAIKSSWEYTLQSDGAGDASATLAEAPLPGNETSPSSSDTVYIGRNVAFGKGGNAAWHVVVSDNQDEPEGEENDPLADTDNTLALTVTATFPDGSQRQMEALVEYVEGGTWSPEQAILSAGGIQVSGDVDVLGDKGSIHTNEHLEISGNAAVIAQDATASGLAKISDGATIGGTASGHQATMEIPEINPADFLSTATYRLGADGIIRNAVGTAIFDGTARRAGAWNGLSWQSGQSEWQLNDNTSPPSGSYYVETDFSISGSPGTLASPVTATWYVAGSMSVTGSPSLAPYNKDVTVLTGKDLIIAGTPDNAYTGLFACHEQMKVNGNPKMVGSFFAEDAEDTDRFVVQREVRIVIRETGEEDTSFVAIDISGNPEITYNGGLETDFTGAAGAIPVRSVRILK